jgi:ankyrin repeat protein
MYTAVLHGHIQVLRILLGVGEHTSLKNNKGGQPVHEAVGHLECLESLCSNGANPAACDACGCIPLHCAASCGHVAAARWLIKVC